MHIKLYETIEKNQKWKQAIVVSHTYKYTACTQ